MAFLSACRSSHRCALLSLMIGAIFLLSVTDATSGCPNSLCDCSSYSISKVIRCQNRDLTAVPLGLPADTRILRLEFNKLTKLAAGDFSSLSQLESLYLYNNHIDEIEEDAFRGLSSLKRLYLESNNISSITNLTFQGAQSLEELLLRNNRLSSFPSDVFSQFPHLVELDLARNDIDEFPADVSKDLATVETLDLSYNPTSLMFPPSFGHLVALQTLKLNYLSGADDASSPVRIPDSAFDGLVNLRQLELDGNNLNNIPSAVRSLPNLTSISLYMNSIQTVTAADFYQPSFLQFLSLDNNALGAVPTAALAQLPYLTDLYLDYNPISAIPARAFLQNLRLETVSVAHTNLTFIDKDAFVGLGQLRDLWLGGNNLSTVADGAMDNINPAVNLQISNNPLNCDCHLRGLGTWLKNNHTGTLTGGPPQCLTPERLRDASVIDVSPDQFACKPRETSQPETTISVTPGMDALLPCAIEADPIQIFYWITSSHVTVSSDQPKPPFAILPNSNGSLLITSVNQADGGLYTCVVSNAAGEVRSSITLNVIPRSVVTIPPNTASFMPLTSPTLDPAGWPLTTHALDPAGTTKIIDPRNNASSSDAAGGLIYGIGAGILTVAVLALIAAVVIARKRSRKPNPQIHNMPLPPLPENIELHTFHNPSDGCCEEGAYAEIPEGRNPSCEVNGYFTRIGEPVTAPNGAMHRSHPSEKIENTYFSRIGDKGNSKCASLKEHDSLTVRLPEERYSSLPSPISDGYMTMKPQP